MKLKQWVLLVVVVGCWVCPILGQSQKEDSGFQTQKDSDVSQAPLASKDAKLYEVIETLRERHLIQQLQLSEEKAKGVIEKLRYVRKLKNSYLLQRYTIENELDTLLDLPEASQKKIDNALQRLEAAKLKYYQKKNQADQELQQMLSLKEQAKYIIFQRNFNKKLKEVIARIRQQGEKTGIKQHQLLRRQSSESVIRQAQ